MKSVHGLLDPEDEGTAVLWNSSNYLPISTLQQPKTLDSSATSTCEPQISHYYNHT
jgi:hypothetical protein